MELLLLTKIPIDCIERKYVTFEHGEKENEQISIRTFIIDDSEPDEEKPTLVIVHGFGASLVQLYTLLRPLSYHYRIVGID